VPLQNLEETVEFDVLIDSGAGIDLIDKSLVEKHKLTKKKLDTPIAIRNGDGTIAKNKQITRYTNIQTTMEGRKLKIKAIITDIRKSQMILGIPWLRKYNPHID